MKHNLPNKVPCLLGMLIRFMRFIFSRVVDDYIHRGINLMTKPQEVCTETSVPVLERIKGITHVVNVPVHSIGFVPTRATRRLWLRRRFVLSALAVLLHS